MLLHTLIVGQRLPGEPTDKLRVTLPADVTQVQTIRRNGKGAENTTDFAHDVQNYSVGTRISALANCSGGDQFATQYFAQGYYANGTFWYGVCDGNMMY